ncbi:hypothetical protein AB0P21_20910 [Kribbella sp. NPDC056861]|uniref:hypothetical protein n=1 Tax=Kribbella sp. NPDC056861 TaxID=3154857 RepID=UPI00341E63AF
MSIEEQVPRVLFVDDGDLTETSVTEEALGVSSLQTRIRHPEEVNATDLGWADLVVVDYFLEDWQERDAAASAARAPMNGLAVAATLRSSLLPSLRARREYKELPVRPVAFALWSGNLAEASFGLPEVVLPHVFSRENNLEWAFRRQDLLSGEGDNLLALARAVATLPEVWSSREGESAGQLWRLLGLRSDGNDWSHQAETDVLDCRPPLHELGERSRGLVLLRWLLHRIFPYPCFLMDERQLCVRLRVESLPEDGSDGDGLRPALVPYEYTGTLAGFGGKRWWRAGVEEWLFQQTEGAAGDSRAVAELAKDLGAKTEREWLRPVIVITEDLARADGLVEVEQSVRVRPDDWPPYADDAFARIEDVTRHSTLMALVNPADRYLISPETTDE